MTTVSELQTAYQAIIRADLAADAANATLQSDVSLDDYIASLLQQSKSTTGAAVAVTAFITGVAPSSAHLTELTAAAELQLAAYTKLGVANPALGPFEAFGRSFASDPATKTLFAERYGDLGAEAFIRKVYGELYCGGISEGALANLSNQLAFFTKLLTGADVPEAALCAKGAVVGQLIGYAFLDLEATKNVVIDDQVAIALTHAAHGDETAYEAALPFVARLCDIDPPAPGTNFSPPADTTPPVFTSAATATVAENTAAATIAYQAVATDPSAPIAYSLAGADAALFSVDTATGAVRFLAAPDFETPQDAGTNNIYDINVIATDAVGNAASRAVAITVTDVVEVPPDVTPPVFTSAGTATIAENTATATTVYQAIATDPSGPLTFALAGLDAGLFSIDTTTGVVKFLASPDFETPHDAGANNGYDISVIATDAVGNAASKAVAITVTDVAEGPSIWRASVNSSGAQGIGQSATASLSADGRYVAYSSTATNLVAGDTNAAADIFLYDNTTKVTTRVSVDSAGTQATGGSTLPNLTGDGRYIAFRSVATNLVAGDTNAKADVFVHDTQTHMTTRVSLSSLGAQGNGDGNFPGISDDGRYVAFESKASDLVAGDAAGRDDLFQRDTQTGTTIRISGIGVDGNEANSGSYSPAISADGNIVAFQSFASNLVTGDINTYPDIFVFDRTANTIERVSIDSAGGEANNGSYNYLALSADGRYVAFQSLGINLVAGDTNGVNDIFRHDRTTGETIQISIDSAGVQADKASFNHAISANGRYIAFQSDATNLVAGDTNVSYDIFVRDTVLNKTVRVSVDTNGGQAFGANPAGVGNADSTAPSISDDGRYVSFTSTAINLVPGDTNAARDIFVVDGQAQGWWFA